MFKRISYLALAGAAALAVGNAHAAMTVTFAPTAAGDNAAVTATVAYSAVSATGNGTQVVVCYDNTKLTFGAVTYASPPGESQPSQEQAAGVLCAAPNNRQILLSWLSLGGTWPSSPAASGTLAASGNLASITFTTSNPFSGPTSVVATENTALGGDYGFGTATGTLNRPITASTASFTISTPVNVTEGGGTANATVTCTGAFASNQSGAVSLAFTSSNSAGNFTTSASPLSFATCGGATQTITVTPRADDAVVQGAVTGGIALTAPAAGVATLGNPSAAVVNVADNDTPATVTIAVAPASASEAGGVLTYTITRTGGNQTVALPVNITPPASSGRYSTTCASPVNIAASTATATCTVTGIDNAVTDGSVSAAVTVIAGANYTVGSPATATGTITDDDGPPSVSVAVAPATASENGGVLTYTFTRGGNAGQIAAALTGVNITAPAAAARYSTTCASPISFAAASTTVTCTYTGIDNAVVDGSVNIAVTVASGTGYTVGSPATATGTLTDDEVGVSVAAAASNITEGGLATFALSCTGTGTFSIPYTVNTIASDGAPTPASPVSLTCGTPVTISVQTAQNTTPADSRTLTLTLGALPAGAGVVPGAGSATVSVADDDGPPPTIPTMGVFGLGLLGLLIAGIGGFVQRRRK
jgi:hypothetical protein